MTIEERLLIEPYVFKYKESDTVILKSTKEIEEINAMLFDANPEFDYNCTKWYILADKEESIQNLPFNITSQVSWHRGWPFYGLEGVDKKHFYIAEFYLIAE